MTVESAKIWRLLLLEYIKIFGLFSVTRTAWEHNTVVCSCTALSFKLWVDLAWWHFQIFCSPLLLPSCKVLSPSSTRSGIGNCGIDSFEIQCQNVKRGSEGNVLCNGKFSGWAPTRSSDARLCCCWMSRACESHIHVTWVKSFCFVFWQIDHTKSWGFGGYSCRGPIFESCCYWCLWCRFLHCPRNYRNLTPTWERTHLPTFICYSYAAQAHFVFLSSFDLFLIIAATL